MSETQRTISRRTVAAGVAWATPAVAVAAAAPVAAASTTLPQCVAGFTNASVDWVVEGVQYQGCSSYCSHRDVRLSIAVHACDTPVTIRVSNVVNNSVWCAWTNSVGTLTKTVPANTDQTLTFPNTGDRISGGGNCTIQAYSPTTANDGMHINPCSDGPFFKYEIWYAGTATGSPAVTGFWGDANNPPKPGNVTPGVPTGLAICRKYVSGTTARAFTATWSGALGADSYDLQYQVSTSTSTACTSWPFTWTTVSDLTAPTYTSGNLTNGTRCIRFRVRASNCRGNSAYSDPVTLAAGDTDTCGTGRMAAPEQNGESLRGDSASTDSSSTDSSSTDSSSTDSSSTDSSSTDSSSTDSSSTDSSSTDSSSTDSSSTETGGDASSSESTDQ